MDKDLTSRIKKIAQEFGLTSTSFADRVEVARPVMSHIFSERNRPSLEVIQKVGLAFPEVDLEWLVYGKGQMLNKVVIAVPVAEMKKAEFSDIPRPQLKEESPKNLSVPESDLLVQHAPQPKEPNKRKVRKIVYFYEDNSFEEFHSLVEV